MRYTNIIKNYIIEKASELSGSQVQKQSKKVVKKTAVADIRSGKMSKKQILARKFLDAQNAGNTALAQELSQKYNEID
tara:strand:+ start:226 stop:459 length:234 start_codon:yes stop_codon:yes gene_type:complete